MGQLCGTPVKNADGDFHRRLGLLSLPHGGSVLLRDENKPQKTGLNLCGTTGMASGAGRTVIALRCCYD